ncbi:MAG: hypothetical protein HQK83_15065 [Fibrobacteria bacterium]|nr:hypothetical protein [Fibrobacteria bacterium]
MKNILRPIPTTLAVIYLFLLFICSCSNNTAGIETTNGDGQLSVSANSIEGIAPPHSSLSLCKTGSRPLLEGTNTMITIAGDDGLFSFPRPNTGNYTLMVTSKDQLNGAYISDIDLSLDSLQQDFKMEHNGSISGSVQGTLDSGSVYFVFLEGSAVYEILETPGHFLFEAVPPGSYTLRAVVLHSGTGIYSPEILSSTTQKNITVKSSTETSVETLNVTSE